MPLSSSHSYSVICNQIICFPVNELFQLTMYDGNVVRGFIKMGTFVKTWPKLHKMNHNSMCKGITPILTILVRVYPRDIYSSYVDVCLENLECMRLTLLIG